MEADSLCHRFGPGRLPYADRHDYGGGITMAANAVLAAILWFGGAGVLLYTEGFGTGIATRDLGFGVFGGVFVAPFALLASFVVGTLCWRHVVPDDPSPRIGALGGALTAIGSLAIGAVGATLTFLVLSVIDGSLGDPVELLVFGSFAVLVALAFAAMYVGWLVVPLATFGGWYHERAKRRERHDPARVQAVE